MLGNHLTILRARSISAQPLKSATLIATILLSASCAFDTSVPASPNGEVPDAAGVPDADPAAPDADLEAPDADVANEPHLLLSEVKTTGGGKEFIEIYNPSSQSVDLSDYYLADTDEYPKLPGNFGASDSAVVGTSDFIARFPDGTTIAAGEALVMAVRPTAFQAQFDVLPDFRIGGEATGELMREAFPGSINNLAALTDGGEGIVLFYWDGISDLVVDIDMIDVGPNTTSSNQLANKTGLQVDGPDSGGTLKTYREDLATMTNLGTALDFGESFHRIAPEDGHEVQSGGNGSQGHDETSEDIAMSWGIDEASPGEASVGP